MAERVLAALDRNAFVNLGAFAEFLIHRLRKPALDLLERHAVLRTLRPGKRRLDRAEFELEHVGEYRVRRRLGAVQALRLGIGENESDALGRPSGVAQVADGVVVDRKETAGRAVFRRHVAERGAVFDRQIGHARTEILDELSDNAALAQHLRDGENEIGRGDALLELAVQAHPDHFRQQHRIRLAEHRGLGFDAAHAPAEHREPVHHGRVQIGAHQRVRVGKLVRDDLVGELDLGLRGPHRVREVFEIDLVADAGAGRHHAKILERALRPFQKTVALLVLFVLFLDVLLERGVVAEEVHRHRMIDDEVDRHQRIDLLGVAAEHLHGVAHGGEIDHRGHAGEILHQHARRTKGDFALRGLGLEPLRDRLDVLLVDRAAILVAQQVLKQHLEREGQPRDALQAVLLRVRHAVEGIGLGADLERPQALEAIERSHDYFPILPAAAGANRRS